MKIQNLNNLHALLAALPFLAITGCAQSIPDCSSVEVKNLLVKILKEKVTGDENGKWYIEPNFDVINTVNKLENGYQCHAQVTFKIPTGWGSDSVDKESIEYKIQINEANKDSFSVSALANFPAIKEFNNKGWEANQNMLFSKAGLDSLSPKHFDEIATASKSNPGIAPLGVMSLMQELNYNNFNQKLIDLGWKNEGNGEKNKNVVIYTKGKFVLNITIENTMMGQMVDPESSAIWEN